jgi:hypothetical protein
MGKRRKGKRIEVCILWWGIASLDLPPGSSVIGLFNPEPTATVKKARKTPSPLAPG